MPVGPSEGRGSGGDRDGSRAAGVVAAFGAVLLLALHLAPWRDPTESVRFGWVPDELLYRLVWMFAAWLYLLFFCRFVWRDRGERKGGEDE